MIGKTISHYKILKKLGEGGMGVVYKAEDTKLDRLVALKFLPPQMVVGEEEKKRFIQEAKLASGLQHNNICTLHDIGETADGKMYICMDYYEGETLKQRIESKPLKVADAINIAIQTAEGLYEAHEHKIVHRDIKPANIMITTKNQVKIMDFGLSKLSGQTKLTKDGGTLGTAAYMSPEQTTGEEVDSRSDIWSLGVVLFEMITGILPFKGDYEQAMQYSIVNKEPEAITGLRSGIPMELERIVYKTLAKNPDKRYQHVDELAVDLKVVDLVSPGSSQITTKTTSGLITRSPDVKEEKLSWKLVIPLLTVAAVFIFIAGWFLKPQYELRRQSRWFFTHKFSDNSVIEFLIDLTNVLAISPDGSQIVYTATNEGVRKLYLRKAGEINATPLDGTEDAFGPFFSSKNSQNLCFFTPGGGLKKLSISSGFIETVCDTISAWSTGTWCEDGTFIFKNRNGDLVRVSPSGGIINVLVELDSSKGSNYYNWPEILPGGKALLYTAWEGDTYDEANIKVVNLQTGESKIVINGGTYPRYSPTGHIVFGRSNSIWAVPFDVKRLVPTGMEILIRKGILIGDRGAAQFSFSKDGFLVYIPEENEKTLVLVDLSGKETVLTDKKLPYSWISYSPNGKFVVFVWKGKGMWLHNVERNTQKPFVSEGLFPNWTADGEKISFASKLSGRQNIHVKRADGLGETELLFPSDNSQVAGTWSDDGTLFAYYELHPTTGRDIWIYTTKDSTATPFINSPDNDHSPAISPDGRWIAYTSSKTGREEIYITPYPGPGPHELVSKEGGVGAIWSPDGHELFYREGSKMMAVSVKTEPTLYLGTPEVKFEGQYYYHNGWIPYYDIHPEGDKFLMVKRDELSLNQINIVMNWFEELKEKFRNEKQ